MYILGLNSTPLVAQDTANGTFYCRHKQAESIDGSLLENLNMVHDSSLFLEARPLMCLGGLDEAVFELEQDAAFYESQDC